MLHWVVTDQLYEIYMPALKFKKEDIILLMTSLSSRVIQLVIV